MKKKERKNDEKGKEMDEKGIVESFLEKIPLLGGFFEELGKTETFKDRFKEVDEQIKENLKQGIKKKWCFSADMSIKPIIGGEKKATVSEINIREDYAYKKEKDELILMVKVPNKEVKINIKGKRLTFTSANFEKQITLPDYFGTITKKDYEKGVLTLHLKK